MIQMHSQRTDFSRHSAKKPEAQVTENCIMLSAYVVKYHGHPRPGNSFPGHRSWLWDLPTQDFNRGPNASSYQGKRVPTVLSLYKNCTPCWTKVSSTLTYKRCTISCVELRALLYRCPREGTRGLVVLAAVEHHKIETLLKTSIWRASSLLMTAVQVEQGTLGNWWIDWPKHQLAETTVKFDFYFPPFFYNKCPVLTQILMLHSICRHESI